MPVEQGLPWHPVAMGLAGQAIPFIVAASHAHAPPPPPRASQFSTSPANRGTQTFGSPGQASLSGGRGGVVAEFLEEAKTIFGSKLMGAKGARENF